MGIGDFRDLTFFVLNKISACFLSAHAEERLATGIGYIAYIIFWNRRKRISGRISAVLGRELAPGQAKELTREVFRNRLTERLSSSAVNRRDLCQEIAFKGLEHLHDSLNRGKGVILWESPFGKRAFAKVALAKMGFTLYSVHGFEHGGSTTWLGQKVVRSLNRRAEAKLFPQIIDVRKDSLGYLRLMVNRLNQNGILCLSGWGREGHKFVSVEFLDGRRNFATGTVSLARMTGAPIIPVFCFRKDDGTDEVVLEKPIGLGDSQDRDEILLRGVRIYAGLLESYIRRYPTQWQVW